MFHKRAGKPKSLRQMLLRKYRESAKRDCGIGEDRIFEVMVDLRYAQCEIYPFIPEIGDYVTLRDTNIWGSYDFQEMVGYREGKRVLFNPKHFKEVTIASTKDLLKSI